MKNKIKYSLCSMLLFAPLLLSGCGEDSARLEDNMAEETSIYFSAQADGHRASISVGERENPYIIDGYCQEKCDFSLIVVDFDSSLNDRVIDAKLVVNDKESNIVLDLNPISHSYMVDLGYKLDGEDQVKLICQNSEFTFSNIGKDFAISKDEALEIAKKELSDEIAAYSKGKTFEGECYLKVLGETGDFDKLFWCFTIEGRDGKTYNVIISVDDGSVVQRTR